MSEPAKCPSCRAEIPADAPGGACPRCALGAALPSEDAVPSVEEIAAKLPAFDVLGVLGRGGMGVVFKARQKALDRIVALKVLPPAMAAAPGFSERFAREAKAMARLAHPNIVAVHEFGERGGLFYLVLEYVDGVNVREAMRSGAIAPKDALAIVPQICDALQYAHDRGVVHRDVKPENVLIARDGRVKIADFGLAKLADREAGDVSLTGASQVMGTLHYMAPEQWERPKDVDHRADIYSLGVVFYEMLTGELPVGRFEPPSKKSQIDVRVDEVVMRSIERDRERRWQRADEMKTRVSALSSPAGAAPAAAPVRVPDVEDVLLSPGVAAVIFCALAAIGSAVAGVSGIGWIWWLVPAAGFAAIVCLIVWIARGGKRAAQAAAAKAKAKEEEGPEIPMSAYLPPRAMALLALAGIALAAVFCGGFDVGPDGIAMEGAAFGIGLVLWWLIDDRHDALVASRKGEGEPPGSAAAVEVVSVATILLGIAAVGWAMFGHAGKTGGDEEDREKPTQTKPADAPKSDDRAAWEFETSVDRQDGNVLPRSIDRQAIWRTWSRAQAVQGAWSRDVEALYDAEDGPVVGRLEEKQRRESAAAGTLGAPLLPKETATLAKFRIVHARFGGWHRSGSFFGSAVVDASDGTRVLRFEMRHPDFEMNDQPIWKFAASPVELE